MGLWPPAFARRRSPTPGSGAPARTPAHTLDVLEYPKVLEHVAGSARTDLGAAAVAFVLAGVCLGFNLNASNLLPNMPDLVRFIFAAVLLALAVLTAVGTAYFGLYARQLLRSYSRWHRNTLATASGEALLPNIPIHPQISAAKNRSMRRIGLIALTVFVITLQAGYMVAALTAGALEFWHVWGWFN